MESAMERERAGYIRWFSSLEVSFFAKDSRLISRNTPSKTLSSRISLLRWQMPRRDLELNKTSTLLPGVTPGSRLQAQLKFG